MDHPPIPPKFCKDCVRYFNDGRFAACGVPIRKNLNLIHGTYYDTCNSMRDQTGACGPDAGIPASLPKPDDIAADRPLIVYGPAGCGKALAAHFLAHHFGKKTIVDECSTSMAASLTPDSLALTNVPNVPHAMPFGELLIKIGRDLQS